MRRIPRWLKVVLVILIVVIAAGLIVPWFVDADRYRTAIAGAIEEQTGRKVSIGKISARLLPRAGFVIEDFHLGNPAGFVPGDFLSVESIRGNLALWPLLHKDFQLSSVELVRPKLMLLEDEQGRTNYTFGSEGKAAKAKSKPAAASSGTSLAEIDSIVLSGIEVAMGEVSSRAKNNPPTLRAQNLDVELSHIALDPMDLKKWEANASLSGVKVEIEGWKEPVAFRSGKVNLANGKLESDFQASFGKATDLKGHILVPNVEKAVAQIDLSTSEIDVDQLIAMQTATPAPVAHRPQPPGQGELTARGKLTVERIRWDPYNANNASAEFRIYTNRVEAWPIALELYGGTLQVSARTDRTQSPEKFSANLQLRNLNVAKVMSVSPSTKGKFSGTGEADLQLFGAMEGDVRRALSGTGKLAIRDGKLPPVPVPQGLTALLSGGGMSSETPFRVIEADLNISGGRISSRNVHADSAAGTADLAGSVGFDGTLDYDGKISLAPGSGGGAASPVQAIGSVLGGVLKQNVGKLTVPIAIGGTISDPKIRPGRGLPTMERGTQAQQTQQPDKKKSILDLFKKP